MRIYVDDAPKNCNDCLFKQIMSQHWDLEDYCFLNKKRMSNIVIYEDCPLVELEEKNDE